MLRLGLGPPAEANAARSGLPPPHPSSLAPPAIPPADIQVAVVVQLMFRVFGRERVGHEVRRSWLAERGERAGRAATLSGGAVLLHRPAASRCLSTSSRCPAPPAACQWPDLEEHSARLEALPRVAAYLASPQRPPLISPMLP